MDRRKFRGELSSHHTVSCVVTLVPVGTSQSTDVGFGSEKSNPGRTRLISVGIGRGIFSMLTSKANLLAHVRSKNSTILISFFSINSM